MLKYIQGIILLSAIIHISSCIDPIDIDLNSSSPVMAVEGQIELDSIAWIRLNYTTDYFDPGTSDVIDDATITLTNSKGITEQLNYVSDGYYVGNSMVGEIGENYSISLTHTESTIIAETKLLAPPTIVDVKYTELPASPYYESTDTMYTATVTFTDDPDTDNFYMVKYWDTAYESDSVEKDENYEDYNSFYTLIEDKYYVQDNLISLETWFQIFYKGTELKVKVYSLDEETFYYYNHMNNAKQGGGGSTLYNPESNFGTEVMGYFLAWSYDTHINIVGENTHTNHPMHK